MVTIVAFLSGGSKETLDVDAILTEGYSNPATITSYPVEEGPDVSDHIRPGPETDKLELLMTNTPMQAGKSLGRMATRAEDAYARLVRWQDIGALLAIPLTMGIRTSMSVENVGTVRDIKTGGPPGLTAGARISLQIKQIRVVQNKLTPVVASSDVRVPPPVNTGNTTTTPTDPEVESTLNATYNAAAGLAKGPLSAVVKVFGGD